MSNLVSHFDSIGSLPFHMHFVSSCRPSMQCLMILSPSPLTPSYAQHELQSKLPIILLQRWIVQSVLRKDPRAPSSERYYNSEPCTTNYSLFREKPAARTYRMARTYKTKIRSDSTIFPELGAWQMSLFFMTIGQCNEPVNCQCIQEERATKERAIHDDR